MKLKFDFIIQKMGDQYCASPVDINYFNGVLFFSEVGKTVFEELMIGIEEDELIDKIIKKYIGDKLEIKKEIDKFLNILKENQLLEF